MDNFPLDPSDGNKEVLRRRKLSDGLELMGYYVLEVAEGVLGIPCSAFRWCPVTRSASSVSSDGEQQTTAVYTRRFLSGYSLCGNESCLAQKCRHVLLEISCNQLVKLTNALLPV